MPELISTFTSGKMNKDLDERLVPNGEYRDALNLEISTSDSSNVGALQNIPGNTKKERKTYNPSTKQYANWTSGYINTLVNPTKIGAIRDAANEKIYWFLASTGISAIAEYDQLTEIVSPILVDTNGILNFSSDYLITGVNIIEDLLFWTDNQTEPKVINLKDFKKASAGKDFLTHTIFNGRAFIEQDITVIKKGPSKKLDIVLAKTKAVDANGNEAVVTATTIKNFVVSQGTDRVAAPIGTQFTLYWASSPYPFYRIGDTLELNGSALISDSTESEDYTVRVEVTAVPAGATQTYAFVKVLSVPETVQDTDITWEATLEEDTFFEFKFPRFAYRYKYKDGYYSTFSPFSEVAFLPGEFDYETKKGYNLGMVNTVKQCIIKNFVPSDIPIDVVEVDLLYKEENNQTIYVIDSFKKGSDIWNDNYFNVQSEIVSSALPSNQILRPYDNVPRKAKAQEITANRLIYGNYLQNFDLLDSLKKPVAPSLSISIAHDSSWDCIYDDDGNCIGHESSDNGEQIARTPYKSVKTQRTYQGGIVFEDKYGRQTPVFSSEAAATVLSKTEADKYNKISIQAIGNAPTAFSSFKYYIKETSNEYYNLAMDRWYDAEDGNVWISFPSAERNKVDESTFLELKKAHDTDEFISFPAKYKVVAISNEAPLYLKRVTKSLGVISGQSVFNQSDDQTWPRKNYSSFDVTQSSVENSSAYAIADSTQKQRIVRFYTASSRSDWYNILGIDTLSGTDWYRFSIEGRFGEDVDFVINSNGDITQDINVEFAIEDTENKPEFEGRFFVKLYKDSVLQEKILSAGNITDYAVKQGVQLGYIYTPDGDEIDRNFVVNSWGGSNWFIDEADTVVGGKGRGFTVGGNTIDISFTGVWNAGGKSGSDFNVGGTIYPEYKKMVDSLNSVGGLFRFKEDPDGVVYKITKTERKDRLRNYTSTKWKNSFDWGSNKRVRWKLSVEPVDKVTNGKGLFQGPSGWSYPSAGTRNYIRPYYHPECPTIEFLQVMADDSSFTSTNPGIFETEPKETAELEIYYAASDSYPISEYGNTHTLDWHNCYSFGNGVESDRIRDDYNSTMIGNGVVASATLKEPYAEERRASGLIFSQIFNSTTGVNNLNQFIQAEPITKDLNPDYGSIQKLHARDTNLVTLCEDKCLRILANKDALFNADGNANVTSNNAVLGQAIPFVGEFGISKNPESFASYGFRAYFSDKNRGVVLRLSNDGLEDISRYGMATFFADSLKESTQIQGSFNDDKNAYNIGLDTIPSKWSALMDNETSATITFKEDINGWESRKSFGVNGGISLNDIYYTFKDGNIWEHNTTDAIRNNFYGTQYDSSITFLINESPNSVKKYKTLNYSGTSSREYVYGNDVYSNLSLAEVEALQLQTITSETLKTKGWYTEYIKTDLQSGAIKQFLNKENKWSQYIKGDATYFNSNEDNNLDAKELPMQGIGRASSVVAPAITSYNVHIYGNSECAIYRTAPTADDKVYSVQEDCTNCGALTMTGTDQDGLPLTYEIVSDNTVNGTLSLVSANQVVFTPNVSNYYGTAGSFKYRSFNGFLYSDPAIVTVSITAVAEPPSISTPPPSTTLIEGEPYNWTGITATDPDHDPLTELTWSTIDLPPELTLSTSGANNTGIAQVTGTVPSSEVTFTLRVTDPDGNFDDEVVTITPQGVLPVTGLVWDTTVNNPCDATPWVITNNNLTIRYNITDSINCGGTCGQDQAGTATATITVGAVDVDMALDFNGIGELQAPDFEKISFTLDGTLVADAHAAGGNLGCAMGPVVKRFIEPSPYRLLAGTTHTLFINFATNDELFHVGAYYEINLTFTEIP